MDAVDVRSQPPTALSAVLRQMPPGLPACALVDLDAVRDNVAALRAHARGAAVMAVVKADGYGHGMIPVARAAVEAGASWLGLAQLGEAITLRAAGLQVPLLAWLTVPGDRFLEAVRAQVDIGVGALWALAEVAEAARAAGRCARVHLKADTGLGRGGAGPQDWPALVEAAARLQSQGVLEVVALFSHLACADTPTDPSVAAQLLAFEEAVEVARRAGVRPSMLHLANSAATLAVPQSRFDLVRPGLAVYGLSPMPQQRSAAELGLRPAMTLAGRLAGVKAVPAGQGVSYGLTYRTATATTLGLLPLGYGDGVPRHGGGCGPIQVQGRRRRVAGRVCMDQVVIDLDGDRPDPGEFGVLFGSGASGEPTAQDWADAADTISYEVVTRIGGRVPRVHLSPGREVPVVGAPGGDGR